MIVIAVATEAVKSHPTPVGPSGTAVAKTTPNATTHPSRSAGIGPFGPGQRSPNNGLGGAGDAAAVAAACGGAATATPPRGVAAVDAAAALAAAGVTAAAGVVAAGGAAASLAAAGGAAPADVPGRGSSGDAPCRSSALTPPPQAG
jgi:hypothetical protein